MDPTVRGDLGLTWEKAQLGRGRGMVGTHHSLGLLCFFSTARNKEPYEQPPGDCGMDQLGRGNPRCSQHGGDALELRMGVGHGVYAFPGLSPLAHATILPLGRGGGEHSREPPSGFGRGLESLLRTPPFLSSCRLRGPP